MSFSTVFLTWAERAAPNRLQETRWGSPSRWRIPLLECPRCNRCPADTPDWWVCSCPGLRTDTSSRQRLFPPVKRAYELIWGLRLTQLVLHVHRLVMLHVFVLVEEVLVDVSAAEEPDVAVVGDGAVRLVQTVQRRTLGFGLHRRHDERHTEQTQQLLKPSQEQEHVSIRQTWAMCTSALLVLFCHWSVAFVKLVALWDTGSGIMCTLQTLWDPVSHNAMCLTFAFMFLFRPFY